jgi:UDP-glucose 4-epimerase
MAKVVVTGGAGFIGHHLVNALVERRDRVVVVDNMAGGADYFGIRKNHSPTVVYDFSDITDRANTKRLRELCEGADTVFHLAALPRVQASIEDPVTTALVNVVGTVAMLHAAHKASVRRFVFASSSSVYGDSEQLPLTEDMELNPMSPYARHKFEGEHHCQDFAKDPFNLETVCLRFFNVYGPRADPDGAYALVITKFLEQKRKGEPLTITGDGEQTRDFTHVSDVVRAMLFAADSKLVGKGEAIGSGEETSVNKVAQLIGREKTHVEARLEPRRTLASVKKAAELLDWWPTVSIERGIEDLLKSNS